LNFSEKRWRSGGRGQSRGKQKGGKDAPASAVIAVRGGGEKKGVGADQEKTYTIATSKKKEEKADKSQGGILEGDLIQGLKMSWKEI